MTNDDEKLSEQPAAQPDPVVLKHREATAIYLGFGNALHDAVHAGILSSREVIQISMIAGSDAAELLSKGSVELRGHDGARLQLLDEGGKMIDNMVDGLEQLGREAQPMASEDGQKVANYIPEKKVVN